MYAVIAAMFVAMFALPATAQSQGKAKIILEAHNLWGDGSGYQMLLDADHNLYGSKIPKTGPLWNDANPPADLYDGFEYKIPADADPSTEPKHMVVDGEDFVEIPAGVYDFCIVSPQKGKKIWIANNELDPTRADDYTFEAGKIYRFTIVFVGGNNKDGAKLTIIDSNEKYDLSIAGTTVNAVNCTNLATIPGVKGKVSYDKTSKTLFLENATITTTGTTLPIESKIDGMKIDVKGNNTITSGGVAAISIENAKCFVKGGGSLKLSAKDYGMYAKGDASVTVDGCMIESDGAFGSDSKNAEMAIKRCDATIKGRDFGTISGIKNFVIEGCRIIEPAGAKYDKNLKAVALNGAMVKSDIVIETSEYDLSVAGRMVTKDNCDDLTVIQGVKGKVSYDHKTKTLTLEDATIKAASGAKAIYSWIDGLTIKVIGKNQLTSNTTTLTFLKPITITGGGVLDVESALDNAIFATRTNLTIEECTVNATSPGYGVTGLDGESNETLTVRNATLTAKGTDEASIGKFTSLIMEGCAITKPEGATFNPALHGVVLGGMLVKERVEITKGASGIATPTAKTVTVKRGTYTLSGVRLSDDLNSLPKGIYIVDGKKVVKK
ncbi:DUF2436 domain-containing protein [Prevotella falsenii]